MASCVSACGHPIQRQLEGRWLGESVENFDDEHIPAATGWARGASLEFAGSTMTVAIPAEEPRSAEYKVVAVRDSTVRLSVTHEEGADELRLILDGDHGIRWMLDDGRAVVMRRQ